MHALLHITPYCQLQNRHNSHCQQCTKYSGVGGKGPDSETRAKSSENCRGPEESFPNSAVKSIKIQNLKLIIKTTSYISGILTYIKDSGNYLEIISVTNI